MIPSTATNSSMNNNNKKERQRRSVSLNNSKKISRTNFLGKSNDEQISPNPIKSLNHSDEKNGAEHESTARSSNDTLDDHNAFHKTSTVVVSPMVSSTDQTKTSFRSSMSSSTKVFQLVIPRANSIKMIVNADGLASALRTPAKIQLTKTLPNQNETNSNNQQTVLDYPLTPPPPIVDHSHRTSQNHVLRNVVICSNDSKPSSISKRHSYSLADWSVPPTSELSPTSLPSSSPDDSFIELDLKVNRTMKSRYRSLSFSCPTLSNPMDKRQMRKSNSKSKSLSRISQSNHRKLRSTSPVIKHSSIERLKRRRRDQQINGKRLKIKSKSDEQIFIIQDILNELIEQIDGKDKTLKLFLNTPVSQFQNIIEIQESRSETNEELNRQTSTPLTFHSISSSTADEDQSPKDVSKTYIYTDIVNELIKGAKGLDKLSCSLVNFTNSIHDFIRLTIEKQKEKIQSLLNELDKKCSSQLTRAKIFCTKKIEYFIQKYPLQSEYLDEITLIVQYFYFYVLLLNCRKQENEYESILTDLIHGKYTFINELFSSSILTSIIEDLILPSSLANEYLLSQPIVINQVECSLPFVRNVDYENELLYKQDIALMNNPFTDLNELEGYLNSCEHFSPSIPYYPIHQSVHSSMYYPPSGQYYYPPIPSSEMSNYYYHSPSYSNCQSSYGYNHHHSGYYNPMTSYHEQYNYYYNQPTSYNSTNDIPMMNKNVPHSAYRRVNSNVLSSSSNSTPSMNSIYPS